MHLLTRHLYLHVYDSMLRNTYLAAMFVLTYLGVYLPNYLHHKLQICMLMHLLGRHLSDGCFEFKATKCHLDSKMAQGTYIYNFLANWMVPNS